MAAMPRPHGARKLRECDEHLKRQAAKCDVTIRAVRLRSAGPRSRYDSGPRIKVKLPLHAAKSRRRRSRRESRSKSAAKPARRGRRCAGSRPAAGMESGRSLSLDRCAGIQGAISIAPRPNASLSRRPTRAGSRNSPPASHAGQSLAEPVRRYEAIEDLLGRLVSYAMLVYSGNTADPNIAKFYGDVQERITAISLHLLFFTLELNRIDDALIEQAMADPALGHYRPWIEDLRKEKPYQLEDRIEQLFHEKSVSGSSAWNRLFDETIAGLRFKVNGAGACDRADAQPAAGRRREEAQGGGGSARGDLQGEYPHLFADHQHARQGQGYFRSLARLCRMSPMRAICRTASSARSWTRWSPRCRPPIRNCRIAITR